MTVLFHVATRTDWDQATKKSSYAPASLERDGFVHCSTAAQHADVANALFAGRRDLVLLLIDGNVLESEVRYEGADRNGRAFPHVYGPVNLRAVFEVAPYTPGADGRFQMHDEATGFVAFETATLRQIGERAMSTMATFAARWWVAGGWALDLFLGRQTRPHPDVEISIMSSAQRALFDHLRGWDLRLAAPAHTLRVWDGGAIEPPFHQVWARHGRGRPSGAEEFGADPTMLDFLLEQEKEGRWAFRRDPSITLPLDRFGSSAGGVSFVRPEVALLYKAKSLRFKDQRDFDVVLPHLSESARGWLARSLDRAHPGHPWGPRL